MRAQLQANPIDGFHVVPKVDAHDVVAVSSRQLCRSATTASHAHDQHVLSHYRSFSVESATSARMMLMIQNRTMILGSDQPFFS